MYEKILQKLKEQRGTTSSVSDKSLEDLAKTLQLYITTDELLTTADFTPTIKSIEGNINHQAAEAVKNASKSKKEQDDAAKKLAEEEKKKQQNHPPSDEPPAWAKAIMEQNQKAMDALTALQNEKVSGNRTEKLKKVLQGLPEFYIKPILSGFSKTTFGTEEEFEDYLKEIGTNKDAFTQAAKEQGLNTFVPGADVKPPKDNGETQTLADARDVINKQKEKQKTS